MVIDHLKLTLELDLLWHIYYTGLDVSSLFGLHAKDKQTRQDKTQPGVAWHNSCNGIFPVKIDT